MESRLLLYSKSLYFNFLPVPKGRRKGYPHVSREATWDIIIKNPIKNPIIPINDDRINMAVLHIIIPPYNLGTKNEQMEERAIIITVLWDARPALTADSPRINAPTILIDCPIGWGSLIPASLNS